MKTIFLFFTHLLIISSSFAEIKANYNGDKVEIFWSQSTATNVDYFVVERSIDGRNFTELMKINEADINVEYYEIDYKPPSKKAYYRIKLVGFSGTLNYSETVFVKNYNELNCRNSKKAIRGYKGRGVLLVLKDKKGKEFYLKADIIELKKGLFAMTLINLKVDEYLVVATSDDVLLNRKVTIIGRKKSIDSFYTQHTE